MRHRIIQADEHGCYEVLPDNCKQYYLECPFCGQEMRIINKNANDSLYVGSSKLQTRQ